MKLPWTTRGGLQQPNATHKTLTQPLTHTLQSALPITLTTLNPTSKTLTLTLTLNHQTLSNPMKPTLPSVLTLALCLLGSTHTLPMSVYPHSHLGGYETRTQNQTQTQTQAQAGVAYVHQTVDAASLAVPSAYYQDPNAQNWAVKEALRQYGTNPVGYGAGVTIPPNGTEQLSTAIPNSTLWTNPGVWPHGHGKWKSVPKKTKIIQSAYCEVCKVDCNSKDVLENHKLGKKHKKNLEKLQEAIAPAPSAAAVSKNPVIGPQENPDKGKAVSGKRTRKKAAETLEDLETKKRKILEGGAAADAVKTCAVCNVVCNSETVFNYHLAGQKHAAMMKKHAAGR
ncbi:hypothetical protein L1049_002495 [Liquidambar formosana]|uniref:Uncharacterized protein n=1 Tax=Liquidambar formosana TaxID=63359 RepID=A0AAP0NFT9_LIQFO